MAEIEGKIIAQGILDSVRDRVGKLRRKPTLAVIMAGNNEASARYVAKKAKAAEYVGIDFIVHRFPEDVAAEHLREEIIRVQLRSDAVMVQLPLPKHVDTQEVLDMIDPEKDADCLSSMALGRVMRNVSNFLPPTASAILHILDYHRVDLTGKHVVIVGQGELVGKALAACLLNRPVTMTVCGLGTEKLSDYTKKADILVSGTGSAGLITADMVKKGAVVVDAGTTFFNGRVAGDVDFAKVSKKARLASPVPGGVGPVTVAKLLENVVTIAER